MFIFVYFLINENESKLFLSGFDLKLCYDEGFVGYYDMERGFRLKRVYCPYKLFKQVMYARFLKIDLCFI